MSSQIVNCLCDDLQMIGVNAKLNSTQVVDRQSIRNRPLVKQHTIAMCSSVFCTSPELAVSLTFGRTFTELTANPQPAPTRVFSDVCPETAFSSCWNWATSAFKAAVMVSAHAFAVVPLLATIDITKAWRLWRTSVFTMQGYVAVLLKPSEMQYAVSIDPSWVRAIRKGALLAYEMGHISFRSLLLIMIHQKEVVL